MFDLGIAPIFYFIDIFQRGCHKLYQLNNKEHKSNLFNQFIIKPLKYKIQLVIQ